MNRWELYDLTSDRTETNDLGEKHPDRVQTMSQKWFAWAEQTGVKVRRAK